jgi:hypothetical protein
MTVLKTLAVVGALAGSTTLALAQGPGIAPNSSVVPPQGYYGTNGYGYPGYAYAPRYSGYSELYNYAPGYYRYGYARPYVGRRYWHY